MPSRPIGQMARDEFCALFGSDLRAFPRNVVLVGHLPDAAHWIVGWAGSNGWAASPDPAVRHVVDVLHERVTALLGFLDDHVVPLLALRPLWFPLCYFDGWRERIPYSRDYRWVPSGEIDDVPEWQGAPGELPLLGSRRRIACFGAHRGDPSAVLLPETHWLGRGYYAAMFAEVDAADRPWQDRRPRAIFAGGDNGTTFNFLPPIVPGRPHPRRWLEQCVATAGLPVDVRIGGGVSRAEQMGYRWILDVDGWTRTWDAFAWKMRSGSVVLSPASPWESFFTRRFEPWTHYVPVANDFSDLGERLAWCEANDDEARAIALRARARVDEVYQPQSAGRIVARQLRDLLDTADAAERASGPVAPTRTTVSPGAATDRRG